LTRDPRLAPKGAVFGTPEYMSPEQARGEDAISSSDLYALGILFFEMLTGRLPFRSGDRDELLEMQRKGKPPSPRKYRPEIPEQAEHIILKLLEKNPEDRFRDGHHLKEELKEMQRSLPSREWDQPTDLAPAAPPPPPPAQTPGVVEWSRTAANFLRAVARAYPDANAPTEIQGASDKIWELASRASRLEGELESHSKKLETIEKRGRALRAEIGRKVEDLAGEESRALRDASSERDMLSQLILKRKRAKREHQAAQAEVKAAGNNVERVRRGAEAFGSTRAQVEVLESVARDYERRARSKEDVAAERRKQIEELRAQLKRYSEALENDLQTGRERIANRVREALTYEKAFGDASSLLLDHLRDKPECRELLEDIDKRTNGKRTDDKPSELQELMEQHVATR
jgi:serine/threonine-protein kinase